MQETDTGSRQPDQGQIAPFGEMTDVLIRAEALPSEDAKELLRFEYTHGESPTGYYRYDLLLLPQSSLNGGFAICLRVRPAPDAFVGEAWEEFMWARDRAEKQGAIFLRTGTLHISEAAIRDIRPTAAVPDTQTAMGDVLRNHFPNHEAIVQDLDKRESDLGVVPH